MIPIGASMSRGTKKRAWVVTDGNVFRDCSVWKERGQEPTVWGKVGVAIISKVNMKTNLKANVEAHLWPHPSSCRHGNYPDMWSSAWRAKLR